MSLIGKRVAAWCGERQDHKGTVTRVDGIYYCFILWDDGHETRYESAAIMMEANYRGLPHAPGVVCNCETGNGFCPMHGPVKRRSGADLDSGYDCLG